MEPTRAGRFCATCDKQLVDLSGMTERDAVLAVSLVAPGSLCARIVMRRDEPVFRRGNALIAAAALAVGCGGTAPRGYVGSVAIVRGADADHDGIDDADDKCPTDPEDKDGFEDADGCPDLDNDGDQVVDANDKCPNDPETFNGFEDEDGCPDRLGLVVSPMVVAEVQRRIEFPPGSMSVMSKVTIEELASFMTHNPGLGRLIARGHAAVTEKRRAELARDRANAVVEALVKAGVERARLGTTVIPPADTDKPDVDFVLEP
jgi:outer membrane protein OmpA-like peptidoglycan-associated protein